MAKKESTESTVGGIIRELENNYNSGITTVSKHVQVSMKEDLDKIDAYINSKHTTGSTDSQGREKPFFNVVTAARNVWYRATDLDRKNVRIRARKIKKTIVAFLATAKLQEWMDRVGFGKFLNKWGLTLATYGSAVLKFVVKDGELHCDVVAWNRLIVDPISFEGNPVIEVLELTPGQLRERKGYDQDIVEALISAQATRKTLDGTTQDNKIGYIRLYEVHANWPLSYLTHKKKDDDTYVDQMHVISFVAGKEEGTWDDYTLISGRAENPYMITHLIEEDGQTLSIGAVKNLFEVQWMQNHSAKLVKDQLDMASKLLYQTSDGNFVGQNALTAIENGDILVHQPNQPITQINNTSHDITAIQNFAMSWKNLGMEINGISESMLGASPVSHTAWKQTQAVLNESYSLFEMMTENKKLALEDMLRRFIIPYIKKYQLNNNDEIAATLDSYSLNQIDSRYISNVATKEVNRRIVKKALNDENVTPEEQMHMMAQVEGDVRKNLSAFGNERFFAPDEVNWKKELGGLEWEVEVVLPGETEDTQEALTTLDTTFKTLVALQGRPMTPDEKLIFNKILMKAGQVSPAELAGQPAATMPQPTAPMPQPTM